MFRKDSRTHFERIGGETVVKDLVNRFYDIMDQDPAAHEIRLMHPNELTGSRMKLYEFLVGWLGGPPLYMDKYGHPRLRMRHIHVAIGEKERDQWMYCINQAMDDLGIDKGLRKELSQALHQVADFMRNKEG